MKKDEREWKGKVLTIDEFTLSSLEVLQGFSFFLQIGFTLILATLDGLDVGLLEDIIGGMIVMMMIVMRRCHCPFEGLSDIGSPRADDHDTDELPWMPGGPITWRPLLQAPPTLDYVACPEGARAGTTFAILFSRPKQAEVLDSPADSVFMLLSPSYGIRPPSAEETESFETDESTATPPPQPAYRVDTRISIIPSSRPTPLWSNAEVARPSRYKSTPPPPTPCHVHWAIELLNLADSDGRIYIQSLHYTNPHLHTFPLPDKMHHHQDNHHPCPISSYFITTIATTLTAIEGDRPKDNIRGYLTHHEEVRKRSWIPIYENYGWEIRGGSGDVEMDMVNSQTREDEIISEETSPGLQEKLKADHRRSAEMEQSEHLNGYVTSTTGTATDPLESCTARALSREARCQPAALAAQMQTGSGDDSHTSSELWQKD
ncbi:hypothetical protein Tco_0968767 [Tanacetum coccineum]